jgi:hypothetical protein
MTTAQNAAEVFLKVPPPPELIKPYDYAGMGAVSGIQHSLEYMAGVLIDGRDTDGNSLQLGSKFFVESGTCDRTTSDTECAGQPRYLYFDTVPSATQPCESATQPIDPKGKTTFPQGLLSGVVDDTVKLNPFELTTSLFGKGSLVNNTCVKRTLPVGKVVPYGGTELTLETRCTAPDMPLVCGGSDSSNLACVPYEPVPSFRPLNDMIQKVINEAALLANPAATPGTYPPRITTTTSSSTLRVNKNDGLWRRLCTRTEEAVAMALNDTQVLPNPSGNQVELSTTARCLVKVFACKPSAAFGSGWFCYCWTAIHGFRNLPAATAINHGRGCSSIVDAKPCVNGAASQMYCSWVPESGCSAAVPVVQVYWVGYINQNTMNVLLDPTLFDAGIGNPPGEFGDMPTQQFAAVSSGDDTFTDYKAPLPDTHTSRYRHQSPPLSSFFTRIPQRPPPSSPLRISQWEPTHTHELLVFVLLLLVFCVAVCFRMVRR